uniref:Uncharacterized protein n=1 Tax=Nelumbo nucifera TaxID=4432 RepID=A0A822XUI6_NELNU|nr:TPA_asm: hypothetical protein HUJ06_024029 [Nelumbo nucifera]
MIPQSTVQTNRETMEALLVKVIEVKARSSVSGNEIGRRHWRCRRAGDARVAGGEDGVVLKQHTFNFLLCKGLSLLVFASSIEKCWDMEESRVVRTWAVRESRLGKIGW